MISILKIQINIVIKAICAATILVFAFAGIFAHAQTALTLSVSPTIFDMSASPTQEWSSSVRVINSNPYEIIVYANVVNFSPDGEAGQGKFHPVAESESDGSTIAEWFDIAPEAIVIPPEQTFEVPFKIVVPENAPPGGHFAALLIGTKPPIESDQKNNLETSQIVTTLVFLRVEGDVIEDGDIRSFRTTKGLLEKPEVNFELRFENKGNVHVLPQGGIKIHNMWGQERGFIPVNRDTMFGNVLPGSVREFNFTWSGEWSVADIGRYKAVATLAYGGGAKQFSSMETAFWVIPWKIMGGILLLIIGFGALITWAVKLYVRRMLLIAGVAPQSGVSQVSGPNRNKKVSVVAPIEAGMLDLRGQLQNDHTWHERIKTVIDFVKVYRIFFMVSVAVACFCATVFWYVQNASVSERSYEVTIEGLGDDIKITSEEIQYSKLREEEVNTAVTKDENLPPINIVNRSGVSGLAAELRIRLENEGYEVVEMQNDFGVAEENTVIVYDPDFTDAAQTLSQKTYGALLSSYVGASDDVAPITIYVGKDLENAVQ